MTAKVNSSSAVRQMTTIGIFAAFMCIISPFAVPIGPISITLATFAVYLASATLGWKRGGAAVAIYLLLGFIGLPVFSGFTGGVQRIVGARGGYLMGYIPCAVVTGLFIEKFKKVWSYSVGMVIGTAVLYTFGTVWYCVLTDSEVLPAVMLCVVPFLVGDAIKIACATVLSIKLRTVVNRFM